MADDIKQVVYYLGAISNKQGEGVRVLNAIKDAGVNLVGFLGYPKGRKAEVIFVVDPGAKALGPIAKKLGFELGRKEKGFLVSGEDRLGAVVETLSKISEKGINIVSVHAVADGVGRWSALVVVDAADLRKAGKALGV